MASKFVLDAHALIWYLEGNRRLGTAAKIIVDDPASDLILPVIALAEAAHIISKGRTLIVSANVLWIESNETGASRFIR
jgi:PIN domain nuclease of toxin-antitoxin system